MLEIGLVYKRQDRYEIQWHVLREICNEFKGIKWETVRLDINQSKTRVNIIYIDKDVNLQPFKIDNMDLYLQERNNYYIHQERQASVLTRHQKKQKISNNEEATSTKITNTSKTPPIPPLSPFQLEAMNRKNLAPNFY